MPADHLRREQIEIQLCEGRYVVGIGVRSTSKDSMENIARSLPAFQDIYVLGSDLLMRISRSAEEYWTRTYIHL